MSDVNSRNDSEMEIMREIAQSGNDHPVLMINLNYYSKEA